MKQIELQARPVYPGRASGEAIVCPQSIQGWSGVSDETGCIIEAGHVAQGRCIRDKILVIPYDKGSTGWSGHFHAAAIAGFSPAGWVFARGDARCGGTAAVLEVPAVADFAENVDIFSIIETGDWVEIDGSTGRVTVSKPGG